MALQEKIDLHGIQFFTQREFERVNPHRNWRKKNKVPFHKKRAAIRVLLAADRIRREWGGPVVCISGYRSRAYNKEVGGATRSRHIYADAMDLRPVSGNLDDFARLCLEVMDWYEARGIRTGFAKYSSFVHIDVGGRPRTWRG